METLKFLEGAEETLRLFRIKMRNALKSLLIALILHSQNLSNVMATNSEIRRECRFYVCLVLGFSLMVIGFKAPPLGIIHNSVIVSAGIILCIGALAVGIDLKGCIREFRLLMADLPAENKKDNEQED